MKGRLTAVGAHFVDDERRAAFTSSFILHPSAFVLVRLGADEPFEAAAVVFVLEALEVVREDEAAVHAQVRHGRVARRPAPLPARAEVDLDALCPPPLPPVRPARRLHKKLSPAL